MWNLKACAVCFSTSSKLYSLNVGCLRKEFNIVSGIETNQENGILEYLCVQCKAYVKKFKSFRNKCHRAHFTMRQILLRNKEIKMCNIKALNRQLLGVMPSLSYVNLSCMHYEQAKFQWITHCRSSTTQLGVIPIAHYSTLTTEDTFEKEMTTVNDNSKNSDLHSYVKTETDNKKSLNIVKGELNNIENGEYLDQHKDENDDSFADDYNGACIDSEFVKPDLGLLDCKVDGSNLNEEYGDVVAITVKEAKAAHEVYKFCSLGPYICECGIKFTNADRFKDHRRRHDKHFSGNFHCEICDVYFRTEFLLQCHMTDKHMYKYLCRKCPEVTFTRTSAKHHYAWYHLQSGVTPRDKKWKVFKRPAWLHTKQGKKIKIKKAVKKVPKDYPIYSPVAPLEQYSLVDDRKKSRNYLEAKFKCELCYRGYRLPSTYQKHLTKHDSASGNVQCDICKIYFRDTRKLYKHMNIYHLFKYSCQFCDHFSTNRGQALSHYKWHKNVTYDCPHCDKKFVKMSTRLTHIRLKHPSTVLCNICGHSFVSTNGLYCHQNLAHTPEEIEKSEAMTIRPGELHYCGECEMQFASETAFYTHLGSSSKHVETNISVFKCERTARRTQRIEDQKTRAVNGVKRRGRPRSDHTSEVLNTGISTATNCDICGTYLTSDVMARKHYESEHPGADYLKRYMCDVCGHTTKQYANLLVHMRTHTNEKPYECPHCDRRFSMLSNRDRHLVVHTGEKRYQCQYCNRRFTQSSAVKLHIQTVHMKIPYAPWDKANRKRKAKAAQGTEAVTAPPAVVVLQPPPQHKILLDTQGDYINAYITYNDV